MRKLFNTKVIIILVVAALITAGLTIASGVGMQTIPGTVMQVIMAPVKAVGTGLANTAELYYSYMFKYEALAAENAELQKKIAEMEDVARQADSVNRENTRLRSLLNLPSAVETYKMVDAYIIGWNTTDWNSTLTINRGTSVGIQQNMCAVTENGQVVGLVTEAGPNYAVIKTILDSTLEVSGTISVSGYNGMVKGGYIDGHDTLLKMQYLPSSAIIRNTDQVVTSGSTLYPKGLIIGKVVDAGFEETGVAKFALLEPAAEINTLEQIFIITEYATQITGSTGASEAEETTAPTDATAAPTN